MKQINSVILGMNKNADVVLVADVEMGGEDDIDTLFLCYFTILADPLRLSVITTGQLIDKLGVILNRNTEDMKQLMIQSPNDYAQLVQENTETLMDSGVEQTRIMLDSDETANQGRALIASILNSGQYLQKTRFHFADGTTQEQEQKVPIKGMESTFKTMLEICKNWEEVVV
tara:strand:+ start:2253 stop:2768 length:516 start_codon:yes stop_codon:yes gene_type:complete